jgi:hypothetical protein
MLAEVPANELFSPCDDRARHISNLANGTGCERQALGADRHSRGFVLGLLVHSLTEHPIRIEVDGCTQSGTDPYDFAWNGNGERRFRVLNPHTKLDVYPVLRIRQPDKVGLHVPEIPARHDEVG